MTDITALTVGGGVGILAGALIAGWWVAARLRGRFYKELMETAERAQRAETVAAELRRQTELEQVEIARLRSLLSESQQAYVAAETRREEALKRVEEQQATLSQARLELAETFQALSGTALQRNNEAFLNLARAAFQAMQAEAKGELSRRQQAIDELVKPLHETLSRYADQLRQLEQSRQTAYGGLDQHLRLLAESQQRLQQETGQLVNALRTPTVRGRWGEMTLKRVAELAGMVPHCDFFEQESVVSEEGRARPDMVVRLPGGRQIVIDAKAVLSAYLEAHEASDDSQRAERLKRHAAQVRSRLEELSLKAYWTQFDLAPEFVVLFLPGEQFLGAALEQDPTLIEDGFSRGVVVATPTTLMALLRAVAYGWRQEQLNAHAQEAGRLGKDLYERMALLAQYLNEIGTALGKSVAAYNRAVGSLESRVWPAARKFKDLGIATDKEVPLIEPVEQAPRLGSGPAAEEWGATYDR
jgi:DNA recombination protein RmuC